MENHLIKETTLKEFTESLQRLIHDRIPDLKTPDILRLAVICGYFRVDMNHAIRVQMDPSQTIETFKSMIFNFIATFGNADASLMARAMIEERFANCKQTFDYEAWRRIESDYGLRVYLQ